MDYIWIRAWGRLLGSYQYYIDDQVAKARADKAPEAAIYLHKGEWMTVADITDKGTRQRLDALVEQMKHKAPSLLADGEVGP